MTQKIIRDAQGHAIEYVPVRTEKQIAARRMANMTEKQKAARRKEQATRKKNDPHRTHVAR